MPLRRFKLLRSRTVVVLWMGTAAGLALVPRAEGDVFRMKQGEDVEGELLEDVGDAYRVRTRLGIVDIEKSRVAGVKKKKSPWQVYAQKRKQCPPTAEGHLELAEWCEKNGLGAERQDELETVIDLDPDHAEARKALGFEPDDKGGWRRARSAVRDDADRLQREQERLVQKLVSQWFVKIQAIHRSRLAGRDRGIEDEKFRKGREQILGIRDPLALPALAGVLSTGDTPTRGVLIEALARFEQDEATMNLLVMALLDPSADIRRRAAVELIPRKDDRVVARLCDALNSKDEGILRHAAVALGTLKAADAVEALIPLLSTSARRSVLVNRPVYLGGIYSSFGGWGRIAHGGQLLRYRPSSIGVLGTGTMVGTYSFYQKQVVSIHRTEVQEALISITGQNFGFDGSGWRKWWQENGRQ